MQLKVEETKVKSKKVVAEEIEELPADESIVNKKSKKSSKNKTKVVVEVAAEEDEEVVTVKKSKKRKVKEDEEMLETAEEEIKAENGIKSAKKRKLNDEVESVKEESESAKVSTKKSKKNKITNDNNISEIKNGNDTNNGDEKMEEDAEEELDNDPGSFKKFSISESLQKKLIAQGVKKLFPVQYESFSDIISGSDVIVQSRTGSGKTYSFSIPVIELLLKAEKDGTIKKTKSPKVLVLAPTRELAVQVSECFSGIAADNMTVLSVYGGTDIYKQIMQIKKGVDILVGTPGRVQDLLDRKVLDLTCLRHVILDEVDRMLEMGFAEPVDKILQMRYNQEGSENPQTLLFSATMPPWVKQTAMKYLRPDHRKISLVKSGENQTSTTVQHLAIQCSYADRASTISSVIRVYSGSQGRAMIFCRTKKDADELALSNEMKTEAHVIHGDVPQEKREMVLKGFREGRYRCLIATDVAARGLDIPEVDLVIQCQPPQDVESYIHRSGRTGRAGRQGTCVLFFKRQEERELKFVEEKAKIKLKIVGPPTPADIMKASAEDAAMSLTKVTKEASTQFGDLARKLIEEIGAIECLSAALAIISGNTEIKQRSLISSREGYVTYIFQSTNEIRHLSYVWNSLARLIGEDIKESITGMRFCKDRKGCVFDVPADKCEELDSLWKDGKFDTLQRAEMLPELEEQAQRSYGGYDRNQGNNRYQQNNGFRGNNNGFRGNNNSFRGNNWKRNNY